MVRSAVLLTQVLCDVTAGKTKGCLFHISMCHAKEIALIGVPNWASLRVSCLRLDKSCASFVQLDNWRLDEGLTRLICRIVFLHLSYSAIAFSRRISTLCKLECQYLIRTAFPFCVHCMLHIAYSIALQRSHQPCQVTGWLLCWLRAYCSAPQRQIMI